MIQFMIANIALPVVWKQSGGARGKGCARRLLQTELTGIEPPRVAQTGTTSQVSKREYGATFGIVVWVLGCLVEDHQIW